MSAHDERAAYLEAKPDERTPDHLVDLILEAELVKVARPLLDPDYTPAHHAAFDMLYFAFERAAHGNPNATAYLDVIGIDRVWIMTDALAEMAG